MARLICTLLLIACTEPVLEDDVTGDQLASYRAQHRQIESVAWQYDQAIGRSTAELCIAVHLTYNRDVRNIIARTVTLDAELDPAITAHGGSAYADLACTTARITVELDYHGAVACQETKLTDNQAEAARHLLALGALIEQAAGRLDEIAAGLGTETEIWTWSRPSSCP